MLYTTLTIATLPYSPVLPDDAVEYKSAIYTQSISTLNDRPSLQLVKVSTVANGSWTRSGGLPVGISFSSRKYRSGGRPTYKMEMIPVVNSFGHYQYEWGLTRSYPNGARFDDILYNTDGGVFEHRVREKVNGKWESRIEYREPKVRPKGYTGLTQTCTSCHNRAGTGGYATGLIPGGDTVISDPMDWSKVSAWYTNAPFVKDENQ